MIFRLLATLALVSAMNVGSEARAEGRLRIVEQFGTVYLPLHALRDQKLIEKHGKAEGLDIKVEWTKLSGGAAINDALLSGAVDVGAAGAGPVIVLWDRTKGSADVKVIAALGEQPNYLITNNPNIKTLKDFTKADKIAVPAVVVSQQSRLLEIAAEKEFGEGKYNVLDDLTVNLPHPDATAALLSGSSAITAHFSNPPYQEQALQNPKVHKVLSSYDIMGGRITPTLLYATSKFRNENPKTFKALYDALNEASQWIETHKAEAAETYIRVEQSKLDPAFVKSVIDNKDVDFTTTPQGTFKYATFLAKIGAIRNKPASWKDYCFGELHDKPGS
ncbi:ABC transporter substrate-binding protein [Bradyrhizobium canariense]|uniref:NitT/TauT family transport system substrate-binding protein n=1 Tax=Bradyrhizobium canariense TaxID=255045 RepID=A0A1H1SS17_9BRAD|nr:ABC transporter substrate-binding protein [Bradyrhizobium canariense]SDS50658.1 NitT/TauT family transport system substrate-binding protein [Bradyrhizobium canariense]